MDVESASQGAVADNFFNFLFLSCFSSLRLRAYKRPHVFAFLTKFSPGLVLHRFVSAEAGDSPSDGDAVCSPAGVYSLGRARGRARVSGAGGAAGRWELRAGRAAGREQGRAAEPLELRAQCLSRGELEAERKQRFRGDNRERGSEKEKSLEEGEERAESAGEGRWKPAAGGGWRSGGSGEGRLRSQGSGDQRGKRWVGRSGRGGTQRIPSPRGHATARSGAIPRKPDGSRPADPGSEYRLRRPAPRPGLRPESQRERHTGGVSRGSARRPRQNLPALLQPPFTRFCGCMCVCVSTFVRVERERGDSSFCTAVMTGFPHLFVFVY